MHNTGEAALSLIRDVRALLGALREPIFAEGEEAAFFRQKRKGAALPLPVAVAPTPVAAPLPPPAPLPEPVRAPPAPAPAVEVVVVKPAAPPPPPPKLAPTSVALPSTALPTSLLRNVLATIAPGLPVLNDIPSDALAKKMATRWKTKNQIAPITVLAFQETPEQRQLLEEITKALDVCFGPAKLVRADEIEREKQWDTFLAAAELKLVIAADSTIWQLPLLRQMYREIPTSSKRMLKDKPLFLLPDLSLYLKDSLLKRSLWKALCQTMSPSSSTTT